MPPRKLALLVAALIVGGVTVFMARNIMTSNVALTQSKQETQQAQEILVAATDLPTGTLLKESDMKWYPWPVKGNIGNYAIKGKNDIAEYVGTVVRYGMHEGEPIIMGRVVKAGQHGFMAAALAPGKRAVSISITPVGGVAGFVFPGDYVDVIVTHQIAGRGAMEGSGRKVSETLMQNVRVLALDQKMDDQVTTPKIAQIATLEVSSKQAESVALAAEMGTLSLALRSIEQSDNVDADINNGLTWDSDISRVVPHPANRSGAVQRITIIRGKEISESVYDLTTPQGKK